MRWTCKFTGVARIFISNEGNDYARARARKNFRMMDIHGYTLSTTRLFEWNSFRETSLPCVNKPSRAFAYRDSAVCIGVSVDSAYFHSGAEGFSRRETCNYNSDANQNEWKFMSNRFSPDWKYTNVFVFLLIPSGNCNFVLTPRSFCMQASVEDLDI